MKKILLGLSVFFVTLSSAQNYPDYYPSNTTNSDYYGDAEDAYYFPDDYYYDYPSDYYTNDFYQNSYSDYRRSIENVNWGRFFSTYRLAPWQVQQIMILNNMYPSYSSWDFDYRFNPDRWYYDRFYALERILGPQIFVIYQNNYYQGYSPVVYYQNYRRQHYVTNIYVVPRYRNINVRKYRIDRTQYHQANPRNNFGFRDTPRNGNGNWNSSSANGFRESDMSSNGTKSNGFRNNMESTPNNGQKLNNGGFRNNSEVLSTNSPRPQNGGLRNNSNIEGQRSAPQNNGGFRNNDNGAKTITPPQRIQNNSDQKSSNPGSLKPSTSNRNSGMRFTSN